MAARGETLIRLLAGLGYGSRRTVEDLLRAGRVTDTQGQRLRDGGACVPHAQVRVDGAPLDPPRGAVLLLNKPVGYTCSTSQAEPGPLVYDLLPSRFLARKPVMSCVGRLDRDTSGLLLLTDDGALLHRLISPRHHTEKRYAVTLDRPLQGHEVEAFARGELLLRGESRPCAPARLEPLDAQHVQVVLTEGRYHQVRRMFAAVGNHVVALRRLAVGGLWLPPDQPEGEWRCLSAAEVALLGGGAG